MKSHKGEIVIDKEEFPPKSKDTGKEGFELLLFLCCVFLISTLRAPSLLAWMMEPFQSSSLNLQTAFVPSFKRSLKTHFWSIALEQCLVFSPPLLINSERALCEGSEEE